MIDNKLFVNTLEENGFTIRHFNGKYEINQRTPAGEDWYISCVSAEDFIEQVTYFDVDEETEFWVRSNTRGKPKIEALLNDQKWKKALLDKVSDELKKGVLQ